MVKIFGIYFGADRQDNLLAKALYSHVVTAARTPNLYGENGVPDTANGRFELIILHIFMLFRRLQDDTPQVKSVKQKLFDCFFEDMDVSLREIGVGPDGVPKRIQKMLESFYGRATAYQDALDKEDMDMLTKALARNFYPDAKPNLKGAEHLCDYVIKAVDTLNNATTKDLLNSNFLFAA